MQLWDYLVRLAEDDMPALGRYAVLAVASLLAVIVLVRALTYSDERGTERYLAVTTQGKLVAVLLLISIAGFWNDPTWGTYAFIGALWWITFPLRFAVRTKVATGHADWPGLRMTILAWVVEIPHIVFWPLSVPIAHRFKNTIGIS